MTLLPILVPILGLGLPTRTKALWVDGVDVVLAPQLFAGAGNRMGTPIESVRVTEVGPGGVSSMTFDVEDPGLTFAIQDGAEVRFHDLANDWPLFRGVVQSWDVEPSHGDQGRTFRITAVGLDGTLDWAVSTAAISYAANALTDTFTAIQGLLAQSVGAGAIRATGTTSFGTASTRAVTIESQGLTSSTPVTLPIGTPLREGIRLILAAMSSFDAIVGVGTKPDMLVQLDVYGDLRIFRRSLGQPNDYAAQAVTDTPAGTNNAEGLKYSVDAASIVRGVVVTGTGVTVTTMDGSGRPGPIAVVSDSTITTVAAAQDAGLAYLASYRSGLKGSYRQTARASGVAGAGDPGFRAGSSLLLTDLRALGSGFLATTVYQIDKTFLPSGREDWTVSYGGLPRSAAQLLRRWTRGTRS